MKPVNIKLVALFQHDLKLPEGRAHHAAVILEQSFKEWTDHAFQHCATKTDLLSVKTELKEDIYKFKDDMDMRMNKLSDDMNTKMSKLSNDVDFKITKLSDKLDDRVDKVNSRIDLMGTEIKDLIYSIADLRKSTIRLLYFHLLALTTFLTILELFFKRH